MIASQHSGPHRFSTLPGLALLGAVLLPLLSGCITERETTLRRSSRARAVGELRAERLRQERELALWESAREEAKRDIALARSESVRVSSFLRSVQMEVQREQKKVADMEQVLLEAVKRSLQIEKELKDLRALEEQLRNQDALIKAAQKRVQDLAGEVAKATEGAAKQEAALKPRLKKVQERLAALKAAGATIGDAEAKIAAVSKVLAPPPAPKKK